jgi:hypothetical protein
MSPRLHLFCLPRSRNTLYNVLTQGGWSDRRSALGAVCVQDRSDRRVAPPGTAGLGIRRQARISSMQTAVFPLQQRVYVCIQCPTAALAYTRQIPAAIQFLGAGL